MNSNATELLDTCFSILAADPNRIDQLAGRTRTKALEYWLQCELTNRLLARYAAAGRCREVVTEWYIPQAVAGSSKAEGECDILIIDQSRNEPLRSMYDTRGLVDGIYIELKTSVHNDFSPRLQRTAIRNKFLQDYQRMVRLKQAAQQQGLAVEAFVLGLIVDATPLEASSRPGCLAVITDWFGRHEILQGGQHHELAFGNDRGLLLWVWEI